MINNGFIFAFYCTRICTRICTFICVFICCCFGSLLDLRCGKHKKQREAAKSDPKVRIKSQCSAARSKTEAGKWVWIVGVSVWVNLCTCVRVCMCVRVLVKTWMATTSITTALTKCKGKALSKLINTPRTHTHTHRCDKINTRDLIKRLTHWHTHTDTGEQRGIDCHKV